MVSTIQSSRKTKSNSKPNPMFLMTEKIMSVLPLQCFFSFASVSLNKTPAPGQVKPFSHALHRSAQQLKGNWTLLFGPSCLEGLVQFNEGEVPSLSHPRSTLANQVTLTEEKPSKKFLPDISPNVDQPFFTNYILLEPVITKLILSWDAFYCLDQRRGARF